MDGRCSRCGRQLGLHCNAHGLSDAGWVWTRLSTLEAEVEALRAVAVRAADAYEDRPALLATLRRQARDALTTATAEVT